MTGKGDRKLVGQDVVLGFKIRGVQCKDTIERGRARMRGENGVVFEELGEAVGWQGMFGREIEGWT